MAIAYGEETRRLRDEVALYGGDSAQVERIARTVGLDSRSIASPKTTALDLAERATRRLFECLKLSITPLNTFMPYA
jgi:3-oxoacyl-[acyl-carrier-protein] synthase III